MRDFVKKMKFEYLDGFVFDIIKISGWVISFIDYCVDELENEVNGDNWKFYVFFVVVFLELDDIIKKVFFW